MKPKTEEASDEVFTALKNLTAVCTLMGYGDIAEVKKAEKLIYDMRMKYNEKEE